MRLIVRAGAVLAITLALAACTGATSAPTGAQPTTVPPTAAAPTEAPMTAAPMTDAPATAAATPAATAAAGVCAEVTDGSAADVEARMEGFTFIPGTVNAAVGDVISWTNADGVPHSVALDDGACRTPNFGNGQTRSLTFEMAGEYPFHCTVHPDMQGRIVIAE